jgi:PAS domain S-box-containing protein
VKIMPDKIGCTRTCCCGEGASASRCEGRLLTPQGDPADAACDRIAMAVEDRPIDLATANEQLVREVEERARVEQSLRESEQRMHNVLDGIITGVLIVDGQTHEIVDVNPHAAELIGLPRDRIIGQICHQFVCPAQRGSCPISDLGQTVDRSERILLRGDGSRVSVLKTVVSVTWKGRQYLVESFVDISSLKQAQEETHESLSLLEATLESMVDGLLVVDGYGKIKHYNQQFQALWRLPDEALTGRDDNRALSSALTQLRDPQTFLESVRALYRQREREGHDLIEFNDGRIVEYYSKPQRMGDRIVGRVWSFRDITEKHTAEQRQAALLQKVAEINEELTHFAYVVSHDLKAPLRGIKLITEWLCTDYGDKLGDEGKEQLGLLQSRVARMHNLIDGVLQYSRVGRIKEDMVPVDLNELIPGIVDGIAPPEHIHIAVQPGLPVIEGERTRIIQVFQNLLGNAVKFLDKPAGEVKVGCVQDGDFWRFSVSDNGPGIDAKYFDRIFRLFQTLAPRDEFESTGVGLAVVKKIVEMYGGRIWVESEFGHGATFFFTTPRRRPSPALEGLNSASV